MENKSHKRQNLDVISIILASISLLVSVYVGLEANKIAQLSYYHKVHKAEYQNGWIMLYLDMHEEAIDIFSNLHRYYPYYRSASEIIGIIENRGDKERHVYWCDDILNKNTIDIDTVAVNKICNEPAVINRCEEACKFRKNLQKK